MSRLLAPLLLLLAPALVACGGGSEPESSPGPTPTTSAAAADPPRVGDCHRLSGSELLGSADPEPPVDCTENHTSQTVHVGTFAPAERGQEGALTSDEANREAAATCRGEAAAYLGGAPDDLWLTRVEVFWFVPTTEEVDAGADWLRCDVVVFGRGDALLDLPRTMKGALAERATAGRFALCGTARPGSPGFERVVCGERHAWRAIATIPVGGGERYPGTAEVRSAGEETCQGKARAAQGNALEYDYGWEWPSRAQWEAGQRHGYCWAPA